MGITFLFLTSQHYFDAEFCIDCDKFHFDLARIISDGELMDAEEGASLLSSSFPSFPAI